LIYTRVHIPHLGTPYILIPYILSATLQFVPLLKVSTVDIISIHSIHHYDIVIDLIFWVWIVYYSKKVNICYYLCVFGHTLAVVSGFKLLNQTQHELLTYIVLIEKPHILIATMDGIVKWKLLYDNVFINNPKQTRLKT
jgi:hypothetical protein